MSTEYIFGEIRALPENVRETRTVDFVISNETKDRHGTKLLLKGWELANYKRNPIVGYQHNLYGDMCSPPNPDDIIGKSEVFVDGSNLIGRVTFEPAEINPLAEKIFQKVLFGSLRTASVGFKPLKGFRWGEGAESEKGANPTQYSDKHELVEWSIVNIPSNPTATKREFTVQNDRALKYILRVLGDNYTEDEIMKMTVRGVMGLLSGESLEKDEIERRVTDENQVVDDLAEIERVKREREQRWLKGTLNYHKNFDDKIAREEEAERKAIEKQNLRLKREQNRFKE